jgi:hypothetical protein
MTKILCNFGYIQNRSNLKLKISSFALPKNKGFGPKIDTNISTAKGFHIPVFCKLSVALIRKRGYHMVIKRSWFFSKTLPLDTHSLSHKLILKPLLLTQQKS